MVPRVRVHTLAENNVCTTRLVHKPNPIGNNMTKYVCTVRFCAEEFRTKKCLNQHLDKKHPFKCSCCNPPQRYKTKTSVYTHKHRKKTSTVFDPSLYKKPSDQYATSIATWEAIFEVPAIHKVMIDSNLKVWDPFYMDGATEKHWRKLGAKNFIHKAGDFFLEYKFTTADYIVTNPPFSLLPRIIACLAEMDMPFVIIVPSYVIHRLYFQKFFNKQVQVVVPSTKKRWTFTNELKVTLPYPTMWQMMAVTYKMHLRRSLHICS
jgi:hypothetical protein